MTTPPTQPAAGPRAGPLGLRLRWWILIALVPTLLFASLFALLLINAVHEAEGQKRRAEVARRINELNAAVATRAEESLQSDVLDLDAEVADLDARIRVVEETASTLRGVDQDLLLALLPTLRRQRDAFATFAQAWTAFVDAGGLDAPTDTREEVEDLRDICATMLAATRQLRDVEQSLPDDIEQEMINRQVPTQHRQEALRNYRRSANLDLRARLRDTDIAMADNALSIYTFLLDHWGRWTNGDDNMWVFDEDIDYSPVNEAFNRIEDAAAEQEIIQRQLIDRVRNPGAASP